MKVAALFALALCACQAGRITAVRPYRPAPAGDEASVLAYAGFLDSATGFAVVDVRSGKLLVSSFGDHLFVPASVSKIATAVAALEVLTPGHRFSTALQRSGDLKDGVLEGDLFLAGGNDPSLGAVQLMELAGKLRRAGVAKVRGRFLFDARTYAQRIDETQDDDSASDPAVAPLQLEQNKVTVRWQPREGSAVEAWAASPLPIELGLSPQDQTSRFVRAQRGQPMESWLLSADAAHHGEERLPLFAPAADAARLLAQFARGLGIDLPDPQPAAEPLPAREPLVLTESATAAEVARTMLQTSSNPMAELFLFDFARARSGDKGQPASLAEAAPLLEQFWRERLPPEVSAGLHLVNGSGLSGETRLSPFQVVAMLRRAAEATGDAPAFSTLLAVSGQSGTLARRLTTPDVAERVWAKTGTMDFASALAGHLYTHSGRELVFAAFVNDLHERDWRAAHRPRSANEAATFDKEAAAWTHRAEALLDALVTSWISRY